MDVEAKYGEYEPYDLWWKMEEKLGSCNELMLVQVVACIGNVSQRLLMSVSLSHVWLINLWSSTTVEMSLFLHEIISLSHSLPVNLFLFIYFETGTLPCSF